MAKDRNSIRYGSKLYCQRSARLFSSAASQIGKRVLRKRVVFVILLALLGLALLPTALTHSSLGRAIAKRTANRFGLAIEVNSISVGWLTPLQLRGVSFEGSHHETPLSIAQINSDLTLLDLLGLSRPESGEWLVRGLNFQAYFADNRFSFEDGIRVLLSKRTPHNLLHRDHIRIEDIALTISDSMTDAVWRVDKCDAELQLDGQRAELSWSGVLSEQGGGSGSFSGKYTETSAAVDFSQNIDNASQDWTLAFESNSVPISAVGIIPRRFSKSQVALPPKLSGNAEGSLCVNGNADGQIRFILDDFHLKDVQLTEAEGAEVLWSNNESSLDGAITFLDDQIQAEQLRFSNDFTVLFLNGSLGTPPAIKDLEAELVNWLQTLRGDAKVKIDLAALERLQFHGLKLEPLAKVKSGELQLTLQVNERASTHQAEIEARLSNYRSMSPQGEFQLPAIQLESSLEYGTDWAKILELDLKSPFAEIHSLANGDDGRTDYALDLAVGTQIAERILGRLSTKLEGSAQGQLSWKSGNSGEWSLESQTDTQGLKISQASGTLLEQEESLLSVRASGEFPDKKPRELKQLDVQVESKDLNMKLALTEPIRGLHLLSALPVRLSAEGNFDYLAGFLASAFPNQLLEPEGEFQLELQGSLAALTAKVEKLDLQLQNLRLRLSGQTLVQSELSTSFSGLYSWPSGRLEIERFSTVCPAFTAALHGHWNHSSTEISGELQSDVAKLLRIIEPTQSDAPKAAKTEQLPLDAARDTFIAEVLPAMAGELPNANMKRSGNVSGRLAASIKIQGTPRRYSLAGDFVGKEVALLSPLGLEQAGHPASQQSASDQTVTPTYKLVGKSSSVARGQARQPAVFESLATGPPYHPQRLLWFESEMRGRLQADVDTTKATIETEEFSLSGDWFDAPLTLKASADDGELQLVVDGSWQLALPELGRRLSSLSGIDVQLVGTHRAPLRCEITLPARGPLSVQAKTRLGWEAGQIAGMEFGAAEIPLKLTDTSLQLARTPLQVGEGEAFIGGLAHLESLPVEVELDPGPLAKSIHLTHEMTKLWIKDLAPPISRVESIDNTLDITIDHGNIFLGEPVRNRIEGTLDLQNTEILVSPMLQKLLGTYLILREDSSNPSRLGTNPTSGLVTMPSQSIKFWMRNGIVNQDKIIFLFDEQFIECTGNVSLDGQLNMLARIPRGLLRTNAKPAGQQSYVFMPVTGTFFFPQVDPTGMTNLKAALTSTSMRRIRDSLKRQREAESKLLNQAIDLAQELGSTPAVPSPSRESGLPVSLRSPADSNKTKRDESKPDPN